MRGTSSVELDWLVMGLVVCDVGVQIAYRGWVTGAWEACDRACGGLGRQARGAKQRIIVPDQDTASEHAATRTARKLIRSRSLCASLLSLLAAVLALLH